MEMSDRPKFEIDERKRVEGGQNAYKGKECENNSFCVRMGTYLRRNVTLLLTSNY